MRRLLAPTLLVLALVAGHQALADATRGGPLGVPIPLFPGSSWWNVDISEAPVDPGSASFISFIGSSRGLHPDFGGYAGGQDIYGIPYVVVDDLEPKQPVSFYYAGESDGVDHDTGESLPFYPIPDEARTEPYWIEGGPPGNQDVGGDRHMLVVDRDHDHLYELFDLFWNGSGWEAGSGAFFDMATNDRRPEGWTSADAAGLAILPGLVRYDEVYGPDPIRHALRVTVRATDGHVYPASHTAGSTAGALPMGARLRLKGDVDLTQVTSDVDVRKIFQAMKTHGLIVADNGSDMYVTGTFDPGWDNDVLNPAFSRLTAGDFDVIELGWRPPVPSLSVGDASTIEGDSGQRTLEFTLTLSAPSDGPVTVDFATDDGTAASSPPPP